MTCSICEIPVHGNYCSSCGQEINNSAPTFKGMIRDLIDSALDLDKSVIPNVFSIVMYPDRMIVNYWKGNRKYYPSPFKVLIYALAVAALHLTYVNPEILGINFDTQGLDAQVSFWIIMLPLLTLTSYLIFKRRKMSFARHLISILYIAGCFFILTTILSDIIILTGVTELGVSIFGVFLLLVFLWNAIIFSTKKKPVIIVLNMLLQLLLFVSIVSLIFWVLLSIPGAVITRN